MGSNWSLSGIKLIQIVQIIWTRVTCELKSFFDKFVLSPSLQQRGEIFNISRALSHFLLYFFFLFIIRISLMIFPLIPKYLCPELNPELFVTITAVKSGIHRKDQCKKFISHFPTTVIFERRSKNWRRLLASEKISGKGVRK